MKIKKLKNEEGKKNCRRTKLEKSGNLKFRNLRR
jgi:hypothetical protein